MQNILNVLGLTREEIVPYQPPGQDCHDEAEKILRMCQERTIRERHPEWTDEQVNKKLESFR